MRDVARAAGVSLITVSRAMREPERVSGDTLRSVEDAMKRIGYIPNLTARSLVSKRGQIVGALMPLVDRPLFAATLQGVSDCLAERGYHLLIGNTNDSVDQEQGLLSAFLGRMLDGVILTGFTHSEASRELLRGVGIPVVEIWDLRENPIDMAVGYSNFEAARQMTRHVEARGRRNIASIGATLTSADHMQHRHAGYVAALEEAGLPLRSDLVLEVPPPMSVQKGAEALVEILDRDRGVDAICFSSDLLAIGAIFECMRRGIAVPGDLAITGFGDLELAGDPTIGLTTIRVRGYQIGYEAADMIMRKLDGGDIDNKVVDVGFELIGRASTG